MESEGGKEKIIKKKKKKKKRKSRGKVRTREQKKIQEREIPCMRE